MKVFARGGGQETRPLRAVQLLGLVGRVDRKGYPLHTDFNSICAKVARGNLAPCWSVFATRMIFNFLFACLFFPYSLRFVFNQFLPRIREWMNRFLAGCTELLYEEFPKKGVFIKYINYKIVILISFDNCICQKSIFP